MSFTPSANSASEISKMALYEVLYLQNESVDSFSQPSEKFYFENFSTNPTMVDRIVDTGYWRSRIN